MKVRLINYTGLGHPDPLFAGRLLAYTKNTRLEQGDEGFDVFMKKPEAEILAELDYVSKTLRSSWEFVDFTFQITGVTRAFTHQFVRTRTASYAQQAQRVVDLSETGVAIPASVVGHPEAEPAWYEAIHAMNEAYRTMKAAGIPSQDARGIVPTNILTNIVSKINLRTLADLVAKRNNPRAQGEYDGVAAEMARTVIEVMPWARPFLFPDRLATPALDRMVRELLGARSPVDVPELNDVMKEIDKLKATWG